MKFVNQSYLIRPFDPKTILTNIEDAARTCYKSEDKICPGSAEKLITRLINSGHEAMLEHDIISVRFITDRGVTHEMVRHRVASFAQTSTRYCNYASNKFGNEITVVKPVFWKEDDICYQLWVKSMLHAEGTYLNMINNHGAKPQEARSVLPNSLATEIVITANLREWRHIFYLRAAPAAHPQMKLLMEPLREELIQKLPCIFGNKKINLSFDIIKNFIEEEFLKQSDVMTSAVLKTLILQKLKQYAN